MLSPSINRATPEARSSDQAYLIGRERYAMSSPAFADAVAQAHADHRRPRCLCQPDGVDMYIARLAGQNDGFVIKRMPETGSHHALGCPHFEPPADLSGLGQVLGSAIVEDPSTGQTTLKLDFPLTKLPERSTQPPAGDEHHSVKSDGSRLSLRGLLHYLWDQAELTRWHPAFAGRRSWSTVRRHLLAAADNKIARGYPLLARLHIPEVFSVEQRDVLNERRLAHWSRALPQPGQPAQRLILIGEVKEIVPARFGYKVVVKHLPDQAFTLDDTLYRRIVRRFESQLSLWASNETLHLVAIATFIMRRAGIPSIDEVSLMPVTSQWLTVDDAFDLQLTERLVSESRAFIKPLGYNLPSTQRLPTALLTDTGDATTTVVIDRHVSQDEHDGRGAVNDMLGNDSSTWRWRADEQAMPPLPPKQQRGTKRCAPQ